MKNFLKRFSDIVIGGSSFDIVGSIDSGPGPVKYTVEDIHREFDEGQDRLVGILSGDIGCHEDFVIDGRLENKANILKEFGFINSKPNVDFIRLFVERRVKEKAIEFKRLQLETIRSLSIKYPFEKFITIGELDRICDKYGLIYSNSINYIEDIPEKNVLELQRAKKLEKVDMAEDLIKLDIRDNKYLKIVFNRDEPIFTRSEYSFYGPSSWKFRLYIKDFCKLNGIFISDEDEVKLFDFINTSKRDVIDRSGYFIFAPRSHFKLNNVSGVSKFGFLNSISMVEDPGVFEYCKNDVIRILTKWGTSDDSSYLDGGLVNGKMN